MPCHGRCYEVCRRLRADARLAEVPVVMVTALDDQASRIKGIEAGADDFITKPFNRVEMRARVCTITRLNRYRRLNESAAILRESDERFRALFDLGPVAIYSCDAAGTIQAFNRRAAALWGQEPKLGDASDQFCGSYKLYLLDGTFVPHNQCPMADVLSGKLSKAVDMEVQIERPDGSRIIVMVSIDPITNERGAITGAINCFHDITERKRQETALRESDERFRLLVESVKDYAIIMLDLEGHIVSWNAGAECINGYPASEIIGQHFSRFYPKEDADRGKPERELVIAAAEGRFEEEDFRVRKDGSRFIANVVITPLFDDKGKLRGYSKVTRDITARRETEIALKKVEDQLRQRQKMDAIGQLAGGIAHDFNNQLNVILGYAHMLGYAVELPKQKLYAQYICDAVNRSADLTRNLLAFARKGQNQTTPVHVGKLLAETIEMLERTIDKRIEIKHLFGADSDIVLGDPSQLQNAFLNLGVNARDAMTAGGCLLVETENVAIDAAFITRHGGEIQPGLYIKISVSDTGTGMSDEVKRHLFEPFFTTKTVGKGTGLGLASVYGTIKNHKGALDVYSEIGRGTTFKLFLPLAEQPKSEKRQMRKELSSGKLNAVRNICVLLVEDEEILRVMFASMLESCGIEFLEAENGRHAVEMYKQHWQQIDVVVLDMIMPEMDGPDAFRAMKKINPGIRTLLSTGFSLNNEIQSVLDEGVMGFIQKPFMPNELIERIIQVMG